MYCCKYIYSIIYNKINSRYIKIHVFFQVYLKKGHMIIATPHAEQTLFSELSSQNPFQTLPSSSFPRVLAENPGWTDRHMPVLTILVKYNIKYKTLILNQLWVWVPISSADDFCSTTTFSRDALQRTYSCCYYECALLHSGNVFKHIWGWVPLAISALTVFSSEPCTVNKLKNTFLKVIMSGLFPGGNSNSNKHICIVSAARAVAICLVRFSYLQCTGYCLLNLWSNSKTQKTGKCMNWNKMKIEIACTMLSQAAESKY